MKTIFALLLGVALLATAFAQKEKKPWTEWSQKDAEKVLNKSGWGQMQTETDTTEMFFRPTASHCLKYGFALDQRIQHVFGWYMGGESIFPRFDLACLVE